MWIHSFKTKSTQMHTNVSNNCQKFLFSVPLVSSMHTSNLVGGAHHSYHLNMFTQEETVLRTAMVSIASCKVFVLYHSFIHCTLRCIIQYKCSSSFFCRFPFCLHLRAEIVLENSRWTDRQKVMLWLLMILFIWLAKCLASIKQASRLN